MHSLLAQIDLEALFWLFLALIYGVSQLVGRFVKPNREEEADEPDLGMPEPTRPEEAPRQRRSTSSPPPPPSRRTKSPPAMEKSLRDFVERVREASEASHREDAPRRSASRRGTEDLDAARTRSREALAAGANRQASAISSIKDRMSKAAPRVSEAFQLGIELESPSKPSRGGSARTSSIQALVNPRTLMVDLAPLNYNPQELRQTVGKLGTSNARPDLQSREDLRRAFAAKLVLSPPRALRYGYSDPELDLG